MRVHVLIIIILLLPIVVIGGTDSPLGLIEYNASNDAPVLSTVKIIEEYGTAVKALNELDEGFFGKVAEITNAKTAEYRAKIDALKPKPKDMFETTEEYDKRVSKADEGMRSLEMERDRLIEEGKNEIWQKLAEQRQNLFDKITSLRLKEYLVPKESVNFTPRHYDADREKMTADITFTCSELNPKNYSAVFFVPREKAKIIFENPETAEPVVTIGLRDNDFIVKRVILKSSEISYPATMGYRLPPRGYYSAITGIEWRAKEEGGAYDYCTGVYWSFANDSLKEFPDHEGWRLPTPTEFKQLFPEQPKRAQSFAHRMFGFFPKCYHHDIAGRRRKWNPASSIWSSEPADRPGDYAILHLYENKNDKIKIATLPGECNYGLILYVRNLRKD